MTYLFKSKVEQFQQVVQWSLVAYTLERPFCHLLDEVRFLNPPSHRWLFFKSAGFLIFSVFCQLVVKLKFNCNIRCFRCTTSFSFRWNYEKNTLHFVEFISFQIFTVLKHNWHDDRKLYTFVYFRLKRKKKNHLKLFCWFVLQVHNLRIDKALRALSSSLETSQILYQQNLRKSSCIRNLYYTCFALHWKNVCLYKTNGI